MSEDAHDDNKQIEDVLPNPQDNPRNARFKEIADAEEQNKKDGVELVDVADEDHDKTTPVGDPEPEPAAKEPQKFKIKVNGVEQELTQEELIKQAELAGGAQAKFEEAARLRKEADELRSQQTRKDAETTVVDDDRALARVIQMGSEEDAAAAIAKIRSRPSQLTDASVIDQRIEFRQSAEWFQKEYPDIVSDPNLLSLVLAEDEKLVNGGDKRPYKARYEQIGNGLRKWRDGLKQPASAAQKIERKATLQVVPKADVRAAAPAGEDDNKSDAQVNQEFIHAEAKRRGQNYVR